MKNLRQKIAILLMMVLAFGSQLSTNASAEVVPAPYAQSMLKFDPIELSNGESVMYAGPNGTGYLVPAGCGLAFETVHHTIGNNHAFYTINYYQVKSIGEFVKLDSLNIINKPTYMRSWVLPPAVDELGFYAYEIVNYSLTPTTFESDIVLFKQEW